MEIVFLTGRSGAGKSQASNILEDWGYTCVDNIPVGMIGTLIGTYRKDAAFQGKLSVVTDVRSTTDFGEFLPLLASIRECGDSCLVIFLDCRDDVLINRYKFTRRLHPLTLRCGAGITQALAMERDILHPVKESADIRIDTSDISVHQLQTIFENIFGRNAHEGIYITCMSFGFKHGIPAEADTVLDVRCFPNPYYIESLRSKTGLDPEVEQYVFSFDDANQYMEYLRNYFLFMLPLYEKEGKKQFTVAIGCTGGCHRSVAIAERLSRILQESGYNSVTVHRDAEGARGVLR